MSASIEIPLRDTDEVSSSTDRCTIDFNVDCTQSGYRGASRSIARMSGSFKHFATRALSAKHLG